jgi:hypothetical protein
MQMHEGAKDYKVAAAVDTTLISMSPEDEALYSNRAKYYSAAGQYDKALVDLNRRRKKSQNGEPQTRYSLSDYNDSCILRSTASSI